MPQLSSAPAGSAIVLDPDKSAFPYCANAGYSKQRSRVVDEEHPVLKGFFEQPVECGREPLRRRPAGSSAKPRRLSNKVMLVIHTDCAAFRFSLSTTGGSGLLRISADNTLVSKVITP